MDEQRTITIIGLEGTVNLEDLHKGIYLVMGKPECVRVQIVTKDEPSPTTYQPVHFWEDQPTAAFWDSFVDVAAGEVIIADAWVTAAPTAQPKPKKEAGYIMLEEDEDEPPEEDELEDLDEDVDDEVEDEEKE